VDPIAKYSKQVMFYVALEQYQPMHFRLIHDELARQMRPNQLQVLVKILGFKPLSRAFLNMIERTSPGMPAGFIRKRYIDDMLMDRFQDGFDNVVILGPGLDTRVYRLTPLATSLVYKLDFPQTITYKERRLRQLYKDVPANVRLVPIDFNTQNLVEVLDGYGYSKDQKSFFIWEGVTQYISVPAVRDVFEFLQQAKSVSCIVFTYILKDFIDGVNSFGLDELYQQTRVEKGLWQFGLHPSKPGSPL
jgi:methyltransferase (TIGR00027 family)